MPKTGLKAFICSFSVSLFAIMAANRAFWHNEPLENQPLNISKKNIVLFLKNSGAARFPVKKIALNALPEINQKASSTPQPEVILASAPENWDFPLEYGYSSPPQTDGEATDASEVRPAEKPAVLADVLYSPDMPAPARQIEAEPIYEPEKPSLKAPPSRPLLRASAAAVKTPSETRQGSQIQKNDDNTLKLARAEKPAAIPLQKSADKPDRAKKIKIGNPQELNHIAMNSRDIPIESMEKELAADSKADKAENEKWQPMSDSPWVIAKSGGAAKNQMAAKQFAEISNEEIGRALNAGRQRDGVQVASETVKNLIIPIPSDIMKEENLTPKLAYPSTSEDAEKEKLIDAKIKRQEQASEQAGEAKKLLSPIEEEVVLDAPEEPAAPTAEPQQEKAVETAAQTAKPEKKEKSGIIGTLNSIFNRSPKTIDEAKEKAIAKAKAKRSFKKRQAKARPVAIMPTEIRLSFQPNRAEISGQTLRWVQAFATKAAETPGMTLEIRIDGTSSMALQQKRLNLLHNILTHKGVEYSKINTVFTSREPNSFILRTVSHDNTSGGTTRKANNRPDTQYIQW